MEFIALALHCDCEQVTSVCTVWSGCVLLCTALPLRDLIPVQLNVHWLCVWLLNRAIKLVHSELVHRESQHRVGLEPGIGL